LRPKPGRHIQLPSLRHIPAEFHGKKYITADGEPEEVLLSVELRDAFDNDEPAILEHEDIAEDVAKDIFVKLKAERA
jgi:hypothetical protein